MVTIAREPPVSTEVFEASHNVRTFSPDSSSYVPNLVTLDEVEDTFDRVREGGTFLQAKVITLGQYLSFFNVTDIQSQWGQGVVDKFRAHDRNGDGYLTLDEINLFCDGNGECH